MQQLQEQLEKITDSMQSSDKDIFGGLCPDLRIAAENFAVIALRNFSGPTLRKALNVSCSIMDFLSELHVPTQEVNDEF